MLGGVPLDERAAAASLRPLLRWRFVEQRPGGFEWTAISACFPGLRPPSDVLADYARRLDLGGLLARGPDGVWRPTGAAARAGGRRDGLAVHRRRVEGQTALSPRAAEAGSEPTRME